MYLGIVDLNHLQHQQEQIQEQITKVQIRTITQIIQTAQTLPFDDLLAAKRITSTDVTFAIPRRNWTTGTTYDIYRHDYGERITEHNNCSNIK